MNPPLIFEGCKHDPRLSNCPYDIRGQRRSLGMMYFPILNEELFWNPQKHRVAPCVWCNFLAVMFVSLETEVTKFLQTFRNLETNHFSSNWNIPFCCFSRNIPFFSPQNSVKPFGVRCIFPRWKRPKPRGDWATNLPWKMLEDFNGEWWFPEKKGGSPLGYATVSVSNAWTSVVYQYMMSIQNLVWGVGQQSEEKNVTKIY